MGRLAIVTTVAAAALTLVGCDYDYGAGVQGVLLAPDVDLSEYGSVVLVRAVPDRREGFSPDHPYLGRRVFEASCPVEHTVFPQEMFLFGDNAAVIGSAPRWIVLAWVGDSEDETWVSPGTLYGVTSFEWEDRDPNGSSWVDGLVVDMNTEYGVATPTAPPRAGN